MNQYRKARRLALPLRVSEWAAIIGLSRQLINTRLTAGWTVREALTLPSFDRINARG